MIERKKEIAERIVEKEAKVVDLSENRREKVQSKGKGMKSEFRKGTL